MLAFANLIHNALDVLVWIVILSVILNWLIVFGFVSGSNRLVYGLADVCDRISAFFLHPLQRVIPRLNGVDISPLVLILLIYFLQDLMNQLIHA
ncbi:MAG: YggT family protein [Alphaproteobacteria bacterium GM202ARS2]|nr:YggT family protein [Alphaproteobacteria bacterium GM202ARS2]